MTDYRVKMPSIKRLVFPALIFLSTTVSPVEAKPNFLFILADDLGYMDVGFNNRKTFYETPNLDRLAASGMVFTDFYAACQVCSPTRASIVTGRLRHEPQPPTTSVDAGRANFFPPLSRPN